VPVKNKLQLITYANSLGGDLANLNTLLNRHFADIFAGGVHILPPFPSSADRGFAPTTYFEIEPSFGSWDDIREIGKNFDVVVDVMVNHISRQSKYFKDFAANGRQSEFADLFITVDKVWPSGVVPPEDVAKIFLRKPDNPFSDIVVEKTGITERVWTSFGTKEWSEQIDLDVNSPLTRRFIVDILEHLHRNGVAMVRLDAVGYVTKKPGTSCFFVEPDIYEFMDWIKAEADRIGLDLLPEVHAHYSYQHKLAERGYWVYDFVLPSLLLHSFFSGSGLKLRDYLATCPRKQMTMLDCHDGIPVQPDMDDVLSVDEMKRVVDVCLGRGANLNRILSPTPMEFDAHQINCTYYDALGRNDDAYIAARAVQFFTPGTPQVYYVGILAGMNDAAAVGRVGDGRAINRHDYSVAEVEQELERPVVKRLLELARFRNTYAAFDGEFEAAATEENLLSLTWRSGIAFCSLTVDFRDSTARIEYRNADGALAVYRP
jgi:sucrose 6(F)-phosphate phosphorylase